MAALVVLPGFLFFFWAGYKAPKEFNLDGGKKTHIKFKWKKNDDLGFEFGWDYNEMQIVVGRITKPKLMTAAQITSGLIVKSINDLQTVRLCSKFNVKSPRLLKDWLIVQKWVQEWQGAIVVTKSCR
eukprot:TRINITY_DN1387_c0_g1_i1.p1 TRINITY_DN1387_c0_g1~~TRINITY_DN1387_c0_g1_i1.p1  ORF type:complete len:127 (+),score=6.29 TRINITY_DN1387_c0_g1_i1:352-732(+)